MKQRLLFLNAPFRYRQGGAEYQCQLIEARLKQQFDITYLFHHPGSGTKTVWEEDGVQLFTFDYPGKQSAYNPHKYSDLPLLTRYVDEIKPDFIYKRAFNYINMVGLNYSLNNNCKMVFHIAHKNDVIPFQFRLKKWIPFEYYNKRMARRHMCKVDVIIGQANYQDELLQQNYNRSCDAIIPNFHVFPKQLPEKPGQVEVMWVANFKEWKHPEVFINLAKQFEANSKVCFTMIGRKANGPWQQKLEKQIRQIKNLEYLGEQHFEAVEERMLQAHIFVNTSDAEGMPNTYIQAWMRGMPVVALNVDPDDVLKTEKIGFHSRSVAQLVTDVKQLIENHSLRQEMGCRARSFAEKKHSLANIDRIAAFFKH